MAMFLDHNESIFTPRRRKIVHQYDRTVCCLRLSISSLAVMKQDEENVLVTEHLESAMPLWYDWLLEKLIRNFAVESHQKMLNNLKEHFEE